MEIKGFLLTDEESTYWGKPMGASGIVILPSPHQGDFGCEEEKSTHTLHEHNPKYCRIVM
jgi:hypothetical protein